MRCGGLNQIYRKWKLEFNSFHFVSFLVLASMLRSSPPFHRVHRAMNNMATRSAAMGARFIQRGIHTTRARGAGAAPWGSEVNEPGGRLFGEKILAKGERRVVYDWEAPYLGTLAAAGVMLYFGLKARPNTDVNVRIHLLPFLSASANISEAARYITLYSYDIWILTLRMQVWAREEAIERMRKREEEAN